MPYRRSFTLLEVLVATIILALILVGTANVFILGKKWILHSRARMSGGEIGKLFLVPLQAGVRADTWGAAGNALQLTTGNAGGLRYCDSVGGHDQQPGCSPAANRTLDNITYNATYNITNVTSRPVPPDQNIRRVLATISWNEPTQ